MAWYHSKPKLPEIEIGSEYVTTRDKYRSSVARILRDETRDGQRVLTLDRLLGRHAQVYVEKIDGSEKQWHASGAFVSVLTTPA